MYGQYLNRLFLYDVKSSDFIPRIMKIIEEPIHKLEKIDKVLSITHENYYSLLCARMRGFPAPPEVVIELLSNIITNNSLMITKDERERNVMEVSNKYLSHIISNFIKILDDYNAMINDPDKLRSVLERINQENIVRDAFLPEFHNMLDELLINKNYVNYLKKTRENSLSTDTYFRRFKSSKKKNASSVKFISGNIELSDSVEQDYEQRLIDLKKGSDVLNKVSNNEFLTKHIKHQINFLETHIDLLHVISDKIIAYVNSCENKLTVEEIRTKLIDQCNYDGVNQFYQLVIDPNFDFKNSLSKIRINELTTREQLAIMIEECFLFSNIEDILKKKKNNETQINTMFNNNQLSIESLRERAHALSHICQLITFNDEHAIVVSIDKLPRTKNQNVSKLIDDLSELYNDYTLKKDLSSYKSLWLYIVKHLKETAFVFFGKQSWCNFFIRPDYSLLEELKIEPPLFSYLLRRVNTPFALTSDAKIHGDMDRNACYERKLTFESVSIDGLQPSYIWINKRHKLSTNPLCKLRAVDGYKGNVNTKNETMKHFISNNVLLINGGTGTGKDTFIKVLIDYLLSIECYYDSLDALKVGQPTGALNASEISILNIGEREGSPTYIATGRAVERISDVRLSTSINEVINYIISSPQKVIFINSLNTLMSEFNQQQLAKGAIDIGNFRAAMAALNDICNLTGKFVIIVNRLESSDNAYIENVKQMTEGLTGCSIFLQKKSDAISNTSSFSMMPDTYDEHPFEIINRTSLSEGTSKYDSMHAVTLNKMRYFLDVTAINSSETVDQMFQRVISKEPLRKVINPNYEFNTLGGDDDD